MQGKVEWQAHLFSVESSLNIDIDAIKLPQIREPSCYSLLLNFYFSSKIDNAENNHISCNRWRKSTKHNE